MSKQKRIFLNIISSALALMLIVLTYFLIVGTIFKFAYIKSSVIGYSMYPTLNSNVESGDQEGDIVYINMYKEIKQGDIVVAKVSWWQKGLIVKRLIGKPGDVVAIEEGFENGEIRYALKVNGNVVYTRPKNTDTTSYVELFHVNALEKYGRKEVVLQDDEYFLMGDNWAHTQDSVSHGALKRSQIAGRVDFIVDSKDNEMFEMFKIVLTLPFMF